MVNPAIVTFSIHKLKNRASGLIKVVLAPRSRLYVCTVWLSTQLNVYRFTLIAVFWLTNFGFQCN